MENVQSRLSDRISNLPDNVMETILMHLPTIEAVRSSILSRKWRHVWTKLPQLILDETLWKNVAVDDSCKYTFTKVLFKLLLGHNGPIHKFTLSNPELECCSEIDSLIAFLLTSPIEEFSLEMWRDLYILPFSLFSCPTLRYLKLQFCTIRSFASVGFRRLTTLKLIEVTVNAKSLASLISCSPLLGLLELELSLSIDICIDAPNLKTFIYVGNAKSINFKRVPLLAVVSLKQRFHTHVVDFVGVDSDAVKFFQKMPPLESLEVDNWILMSFDEISQRRLPTSLIYLKDLKLSEICFAEIDEFSFTFCLLRSSPNLKFIHIQFRSYFQSSADETRAYMEEEDTSDICLGELQEVNLVGVIGTKLELEFIGLLLGKASSLKKIQIQPKKCVRDNGFRILKEVTKFRRISKDAEIIFAE